MAHVHGCSIHIPREAMWGRMSIRLLRFYNSRFSSLYKTSDVIGYSVSSVQLGNTGDHLSHICADPSGNCSQPRWGWRQSESASRGMWLYKWKESMSVTFVVWALFTSAEWGRQTNRPVMGKLVAWQKNDAVTFSETQAIIYAMPIQYHYNHYQKNNHQRHAMTYDCFRLSSPRGINNLYCLVNKRHTCVNDLQKVLKMNSTQM